jgi:hypothetical protein
MKEALVNGQRAVVAHHQSAEVPESGKSTFYGPSPLVAPQRPAVLRRGLAMIPAMGNDQLDAVPGQLLAQRVTVVAAVGDDACRLLPRPPRRRRRPTRIAPRVASASRTSSGEAE